MMKNLGKTLGRVMKRSGKIIDKLIKLNILFVLAIQHLI